MSELHITGNALIDFLLELLLIFLGLQLLCVVLYGTGWLAKALYLYLHRVVCSLDDGFREFEKRKCDEYAERQRKLAAMDIVERTKLLEQERSGLERALNRFRPWFSWLGLIYCPEFSFLRVLAFALLVSAGYSLYGPDRWENAREAFKATFLTLSAFSFALRLHWWHHDYDRGSRARLVVMCIQSAIMLAIAWVPTFAMIGAREWTLNSWQAALFELFLPPDYGIIITDDGSALRGFRFATAEEAVTFWFIQVPVIGALLFGWAALWTVGAFYRLIVERADPVRLQYVSIAFHLGVPCLTFAYMAIVTYTPDALSKATSLACLCVLGVLNFFVVRRLDRCD